MEIEGGICLHQEAAIHKHHQHRRRHWVSASGSPSTRSRKAAEYLRVFDYEQAAKFDSDTVIFAKVICNLRNYHLQSVEQTVELITHVFNTRSWEVWSSEAIKLAWDKVEGFTPSLGLSDELAAAKQRALLIENEVVDLIACCRSGGCISAEELLATFLEWNPDLAPVTPQEFGRALRAVTGLKSTPARGVRYYYGMHLPTADELLDPAHTSGEDFSLAVDFFTQRSARSAA